MPSHNDILAYVQSRARDRAAAAIPQARAMVTVGYRAQQVVDNPAFQTFLDHLEVLMTDAKTKRDAAIQQLTEGDALGEDLARLKLAIARLDGEIKALKNAAELIPELLKRAQQAAEFLGRADQPAAV